MQLKFSRVRVLRETSATAQFPALKMFTLMGGTQVDIFNLGVPKP